MRYISCPMTTGETFMTVVSEAVTAPEGAASGLLSRGRTIAGPRFNRWLVPPAALAIHLCIGMAYGFSVFWLPMSKLVPGAPSCEESLGFFTQLFAASCNWTVPAVTHIFETFIAMLGISAAIWGGWLEHAGPRKAGFIAALCWGGGLVIGGIGVSMHQLWLTFLGCGVLGGVGAGAWLHHTGFHADQMVSGSAWSGYRLRHHGLWRWRDDRRADRGGADGAISRKATCQVWPVR